MDKERRVQTLRVNTEMTIALCYWVVLAAAAIPVYVCVRVSWSPCPPVLTWPCLSVSAGPPVALGVSVSHVCGVCCANTAVAA